MKIVITEISEQDNFHPMKDKIIGLVGDMDEGKSRRWSDGWWLVYMTPDPLSATINGVFGSREWEGWEGTEVCFYETKFRRATNDQDTDVT